MEEYFNDIRHEDKVSISQDALNKSRGKVRNSKKKGFLMDLIDCFIGVNDKPLAQVLVCKHEHAITDVVQDIRVSGNEEADIKGKIYLTVRMRCPDCSLDVIKDLNIPD